MALVTQVLFPNISYSGFAWQQNPGASSAFTSDTFLRLQDAAALYPSGSNSIQSYVKSGTQLPTFNSYWSDGLKLDGGTAIVQLYFNIPFDPMLIHPTGVDFRIAYSGHEIIIDEIHFFLSKKENPLLTADIDIAKNDFLSAPLTAGTGIKNAHLDIVESNRNTFSALIPGAIPRISGQFTMDYAGSTAINNALLDFDVIISGTNAFNSGFSLYTYGRDTFSGIINLYTSGISRPNSNMPLYLRGPSTISGTTTLPLFIFSTTHSGLFGDIPLMIGYQDGTPDPRSALPLYIGGPPSNSLNSSMNLFLENNTILSSGLNLFLKNSYIASSGTLQLFLSAPSGTLGSIPYSGNMPLYMSRRSEAMGNNMTLYLKTSESSTSNFNLWISGSNVPTTNIPLYLKVINNATLSGVTLYGQGY
jgi:hypothetical protein